MDNITSFVGIIRRVKFHNPINGYGVLSVEVVDNKDIKDNITVTINQPKVFEGVTMKFEGYWSKHARFGKQFNTNSCQEMPPATTESLVKYLSSGFFPGIGPVTAKKIVNYFGDEALDIFRNNIDRIIEVEGINRSKLQVLKESWKENREMNNIMIFLQDHMVATSSAVKIYKEYGIDSISTLKNNPYRLATDIVGFGFSMADKLAMSLGFNEKSEERVTAAVHHILSNNQSDGHCYLTEKQTKERVRKLIGIEVNTLIEYILNKEELEEKIVSINFSKDKIREQKRFYSRDLYYDEMYVAEKVVRLSKKRYANNTSDLKERLDKMLSNSKIKLSEEQYDSVIGVVSNGLSILTGGPGVGKCLKKGTTVLMFDGTKNKVENIKEGDLLMGDDSTPRKVLSLARGKERMYDVISNDGKIWGCNESHILSLVYNTKERDITINGKKYSQGDVVDISIKDYLKVSKRNRHRLMQYSVGVEYPLKKTYLDPYLLGLWLGDGHSNSKTFIITNIDKEIIDYSREWSDNNGYKFRLRENLNRASSLIVTGGKKSLYSLLKKENVFNNKHIPNEHLINSREHRLSLLAGLIDSDGHLTGSGIYEITQKNKKLAYDIFELSSSLGFKTSITDKIATMKREDGSYYSCKVYRINISGNLQRVPVKIKRKKAMNNQNKNHLHSGFKLVDKGEGDYYGFEIDGNKRFVLGNYVVTHNTTTVKFIYDILLSLGKKVLLAAPTGRAAQRMSEVIGAESKTIHRLLKWDAGNGNFRKSEKDMLECDFIILDESSMIDIRLASSFFRAISPNTQIVLVGDKDQLPSVGPGNLISDLINSQCVKVFSLKKVFRQAEKSKIITYAHTINKGETPNVETPISNPKMWKDGSDCMFIDSSMNLEYQNEPNSTLKYGLNAIDMIVKLYSETIEKYMGKDNEIQILTPMNKGSVGTKEINKRVQVAVNPKSENKKEITIGERTFREGDRVIQTANNYDLNVFNGDIGYITKIDTKDYSLIINYGDSKKTKLVRYERSNIIEIELAYAITIHKSQGSEFKIVIIPILNQHYIMLYRNLIYTGLTRAKKMGILIGEREAFKRSIDNIDPNIRQTSLQYFLKEHYETTEFELEFLN